MAGKLHQDGAAFACRMHIFCAKKAPLSIQEIMALRAAGLWEKAKAARG